MSVKVKQRQKVWGTNWLIKTLFILTFIFHCNFVHLYGFYGNVLYGKNTQLNQSSYHKSNIKCYYYITMSNKCNDTKIAVNKQKGEKKVAYDELKYEYRTLYIKIKIYFCFFFLL